MISIEPIQCIVTNVSELLHLNLAYSESLRPGWGEWENPRSLTPARKSSFGVMNWGFRGSALSNGGVLVRVRVGLRTFIPVLYDSLLVIFLLLGLSCFLS